MKRSQTISKLLSNGVSIAGLVGGIALVLSTVLSGSGIYFSLTGSSLNEPSRIAVSAVSTLFLTLLAFRFWLQAGRSSREKHLRRAQAALPAPRVWHYIAGGLVMSSLSVLTATTALLYLNNRDGVQALMNHAAFSATIEPVNGLADGMAGVALTAARADRLAAKRSKREAAVGGTCGVSARGIGPLTRMRAEGAKAANSIARRAAVLSTAAEKTARALISAKDQSVVNTLFSDARALRTNPDRLLIAQEADALARGYGGAGFFFENQQRGCSDPELAALFAEIATAAHDVVDLPMQPPLRREVKIFDAFAMVVPILIDEDKGRDVGISRATILPFALFTLLIDLVSLGGAFGHGVGRAVMMTGKEQQQIHRTAWVLRNFVWDFPVLPGHEDEGQGGDNVCQAFVFVPLGGNHERTRQAEYLTALFDLSVDPAFQFEPLVARRREFEPWAEQMRVASGDATHYAIYPIRSQETYYRIMEMKRDALRALALSTIHDGTLPEFGSSPNGNVVPLRAV